MTAHLSKTPSKPFEEGEGITFLISLKGRNYGRGRFISNQIDPETGTFFLTPWKIQGLRFTSLETLKSFLETLDLPKETDITILPSRDERSENLPIERWTNTRPRTPSIRHKDGMIPDCRLLPRDIPWIRDYRINGLDYLPSEDALRERVREELPEVEQIADPELRAKVIEAWALALARSSFSSIAEIEPSGNPGVNTLRRGKQTDHIRGVTRLAMALADELQAVLPDLKVNRDLLIAGALCHDVGKPWEFDPENRRRWEADPRAAGLPSIRHPAYGVHICLTVGLPEEVAHCAAAHSGEGELLVRSLENTIIHHADYAFWGIARAGDLLVPETVAELKVRH
jgi:putative nucleotidyltransferase with HDIG domain